MSKNSEYKSKIRSSNEWKKLRAQAAHKYHDKCYLTDKRLLKGWQLHHLDMSIDNYDDFTLDKFVPLNKKAHSIVHDIYRYWHKDHNVLKRLEIILNMMENYDEEAY